MTALAVIAAVVAAMFAVTVSSQTGPAITSSTDTDFIIGDGQTITVEVTNPGSGDWTFHQIFGFVLTDGGAGSNSATYAHQAGAPMGDFTIRATHASTPAVTRTLTVGDTGTNLDAVNLKLSHTNAAGNARGSSPRAGTDVDETDTSLQGTAIFIHAEALNSLGNASNVSSAHDLTVTVYAVGGAVTANDQVGTTTSVMGTVTSGNTVPFAVTKSSAGAVRVFAIATIGRETVQSEDLNLTFTVIAGPPAKVSLDDGGTVARGGADSGAATEATLPVSATDAAGNAATLAANTAIAATVKGPDGKAVSDNGIANVAVTRYVLDANPNVRGNQSAVVVTLAANAAPGEYTVTATLGTSKSEAMFTVTGPPTNVEVALEAADGTDLGDQLAATATVTDVNGNLVAPVDVVFTVGTGSPATFVGVDSKTKDGVASRHAVVTGTGVITVIATANGVSGVAVIVAGTDDAMADRGPNLSDFSRLSGLASYTGPDATASDLLALLAGRATAIWLSSGDGWVLYSSVDGAMIPGSMDFTATSGDVIYISN